MIQAINGWFYPAYQPGQQGSSVLSETIISLALSALALAGANATKRDNPGLAAILYCVPVGVSLIWLFRRCCPNGMLGSPQAAPLMAQAPVQNHWNWLNWFGPALRPVPVHRRQPAQVYVPPAPVYAAPPPPVYVPPAPVYAPPRPAYAAPAQAVPPAAFPAVVRAPAQAAPAYFPPVQHAPAQASSFPAVQRAPAQAGGFPQVQRAAPQAPAFAQVQRAPAPPAPQSAHPGTQRQMFPVAATR